MFQAGKRPDRRPGREYPEISARELENPAAPLPFLAIGV
jgi:hypothetical protein